MRYEGIGNRALAITAMIAIVAITIIQSVWNAPRSLWHHPLQRSVLDH
jgi:hypothetical protein